MNPLLRTVAGMGTGWLAARGMTVVSHLQATHGEAAAAKVSDRRSFTRNAALGASAVVLANLGVAFGLLMWPNKTGDFGSDITVSASSIPAAGATPFRHQAGKFYLVRNEDGIQALYWKCVHLGCTVPWNAGTEHFQCPCHGSIFDINGARTGGPATRRMDRMPLTVNGDGSVVVTTNPNMIEEAAGRTDYVATDATPYP